MALPLAHIRVVDLTRARSGPTCVRQLADIGAQVIKVEQAEDEEGVNRHNFDFQNLHRNKRSLVLNLKDPRGLEILKQLVKKADVLVENYRPDVKKRLGIDYADLRPAPEPASGVRKHLWVRANWSLPRSPRLRPDCPGNGWAHEYHRTAGGRAVACRYPCGRLECRVARGTGVLVALLERERSGEGQWVHTSLLEAMIAMLDFQATRWLIGKEIPPQAGNNHPTGLPNRNF